MILDQQDVQNPLTCPLNLSNCTPFFLSYPIFLGTGKRQKLASQQTSNKPSEERNGSGSWFLLHWCLVIMPFGPPYATMEDDPEPPFPSEEDAIGPTFTTPATSTDVDASTVQTTASIPIQSNPKELLRVSLLYGSGVESAKAMTMAGKNLRLGTHPLVNTGTVDTHFPYTDADVAAARRKVFENREINAGAGVRALELAITSASISFNELQRALIMSLKLKLTPSELAALLAAFRCVDTFKRKGKAMSRVVVKPFVTGLIRLAESLRGAFRQRVRAALIWQRYSPIVTRPSCLFRWRLLQVRQEHEETMARQQEAVRFIDDHYTVDKPGEARATGRDRGRPPVLLLSLQPAPACPPACPPARLPACLPACLSARLPSCLSARLPVSPPALLPSCPLATGDSASVVH